MPDTQMPSYDLCVLGCGSGGFAAAMRALDLGRHVCLVEKDEIGGAGVMWGALASKTMWEMAKDYDVATRINRGYRSTNMEVHYPDVRASVIAAVEEKQQQMLSQLETFSPRLWPGPGSITFKRGTGTFESPNEIRVTNHQGVDETIRADFTLIATGSSPRPFPGIAVDQQRVFDSDGILNLKAFPKRLMIIGAGVIGCEYAAIFSNFKQTKVYLVDYAERIIPYEDQDISDFVSNNLTRNGVTIFHSAVLKDIVHHKKHLDVVLDLEGKRSKVVKVDTVLVSIGRTPNVSGMGLDALGITPNERGFLDTDSHGCVQGPIFAAGDVTQHPALVNVAEMESRHAAETMFDAPRQPLAYHNMSTVMFFKPAVAAVGLNEQGCQKQQMPYRVAYYANALLSRAIAMRATDGFVKIIVSDDENQRILGMRASGPQASTTIMTIALLMDQHQGLKDILRSMHPHPTMSEGIQECLRLLESNSIYKSRAFPKLAFIRTWRPDTGYIDLAE